MFHKLLGYEGHKGWENRESGTPNTGKRNTQSHTRNTRKQDGQKAQKQDACMGMQEGKRAREGTCKRRKRRKDDRDKTLAITPPHSSSGAHNKQSAQGAKSVDAQIKSKGHYSVGMACKGS